MSDERDLDLVPLTEREAAEVEGGRRTLPPIIVGCVPTAPISAPLTGPADGSAWML